MLVNRPPPTSPIIYARGFSPVLQKNREEEEADDDDDDDDDDGQCRLWRRQACSFA